MNDSDTTPTWDLTDLYSGPDDPRLAADLDRADALATELASAHQGQVAALDGPGLAALLRRYEEALTAMYRPQMYARLMQSTQGDDEAVRASASRCGERGTAVANRLRFIDTELGKVGDEVAARWAASPELASYAHHVSRARSQAPHTLAGEVESALSTKDLTGRRAWTELYDQRTTGWRFELTVKGEAKTLTLPELRGLREDPDRDLRRSAWGALTERLQSEGELLTYITNTVYQDHKLETDLRGYASPEAPTMLDDELPLATLDALMSAVEAHYPVAQEYLRVKGRALGLDRLASWDLLAPWPAPERDCDWPTSRAMVLDAFGALAPDIADRARAFFDERRIDALPRAGKRDGAFCSGMLPGIGPRVLTNHHGRLRDVFTLAHELGHGVHFALAGEVQSPLNYWPTSPMAETASVFGEMVLARSLLDGERDPTLRRALLAQRIEEALGTIHRQVAFTRWEREAHARRAAGTVPASELCALWTREMDRLYGDAVERFEADRWGWSAIPHLIHYRFYCYSYAFGQLLVFALYALWERDAAAFVPKYRELLAGGGGDAPAAMLSRLGVDITDPGFWARGLDVVTRMVEDFRRAA